MVAVMLLELLLGLCRCVEVVSVGVLCVGVCRRRSVCVTTSFLFFFSGRGWNVHVRNSENNENE